MSKTLSSIVFCLLVGWMLSGCGLRQQTAAEAAHQKAVEAAMAALPMASPKLYVDGDSLSPEPVNGEGRISFLGDGDTGEFLLGDHDVTLANDCTYQLMLNSPDSTSVTVEIILRQVAKEMVVGKDMFTVELRQDAKETVAVKDMFTGESTSYRVYTGKFAGCSSASVRSGQLLLRLTITGKGLRLYYGSGFSFSRLMNEVSFITVEKAPAVPAGAAKERTAALTWLGTNLNFKPELNPDHLTDDDRFAQLRDELDSVILTGDNGRWIIGWELTISKKPYGIEWKNGVFRAVELSKFRVQQGISISADQISFTLNPSDILKP